MLEKGKNSNKCSNFYLKKLEIKKNIKLTYIYKVSIYYIIYNIHKYIERIKKTKENKKQ